MRLIEGQTLRLHLAVDQRIDHRLGGKAAQYLARRRAFIGRACSSWRSAMTGSAIGLKQRVFFRALRSLSRIGQPRQQQRCSPP